MNNVIRITLINRFFLYRILLRMKFFNFLNFLIKIRNTISIRNSQEITTRSIAFISSIYFKNECQNIFIAFLFSCIIKYHEWFHVSIRIFAFVSRKNNKTFNTRIMIDVIQENRVRKISVDSKWQVHPFCFATTNNWSQAAESINVLNVYIRKYSVDVSV